jgi:hypothetical protein
MNIAFSEDAVTLDDSDLPPTSLPLYNNYARNIDEQTDKSNDQQTKNKKGFKWI